MHVSVFAFPLLKTRNVVFLHHVKLDFPKMSLMKQDINHSVKKTFFEYWL